jgi:hypothetical protein
MMMMMIEGKEKSENPAIPLAWKKKKNLRTYSQPYFAEH